MPLHRFDSLRGVTYNCIYFGNQSAQKDVYIHYLEHIVGATRARIELWGRFIDRHLHGLWQPFWGQNPKRQECVLMSL